jgi:MSHA pilin protein MshD
MDKGLFMTASIQKQQGFTLIESVIAIIILGIAMITLTSFLFPQIAQSARPHYEVRASALASSFMTEILARGFDENSDFDGGWVRCGESGASTCTAEVDFGPEGSEVDGTDVNPELFNDVDDYIGCWYTNASSQAQCITDAVGELSDIFGDDISSSYPNFRVEVDVIYDNDPNLSHTSNSTMKRILVSVTAGQYTTLNLQMYRGNY